MGEWIWTTIQVGGRAPAKVWKELAELAPGWEGDEGDYMAAAKRKRCVVFGGTVNYGLPEDLIAFCQEHHLTYCIAADGKDEFSPEIRTWKPGWDREIARSASPDFDPVLSLTELQAALEAGKTLADVVAELIQGDLEVPPVEIIDEE